MDEEQREANYESNLTFIQQNNAAKWGSIFLEDLSNVILTEKLPWLRIHEVVSAYRNAASRILLFGYDGVLTPSLNHQALEPMQAIISDKVKASLEKLCADPSNLVYVISNRDRQFLEPNLGDLPIGLCSEYSLYLRECGSKEWEHSVNGKPDIDWREEVEQILREYIERTPGTTIECKEANLVFHYRNVEKEAAQFLLSDLLPVLHALASKSAVDVVTTEYAIEIRPQNFHKGAAVRHILRQHPEADFVMCIGHEKTDEDMYIAINNWMDAWTDTNRGGGATGDASRRTPTRKTARSTTKRRSSRPNSHERKPIDVTAQPQQQGGAGGVDSHDPDESVTPTEPLNDPHKNQHRQRSPSPPSFLEHFQQQQQPLQAGGGRRVSIADVSEIVKPPSSKSLGGGGGGGATAVNNHNHQRRRSRYRYSDRPRVYTCTVEEKETQARFQVPSYTQVTSIIKMLGDESEDRLATEHTRETWGRVPGVTSYPSSPTLIYN